MKRAGIGRDPGIFSLNFVRPLSTRGTVVTKTGPDEILWQSLEL